MNLSPVLSEKSLNLVREANIYTFVSKDSKKITKKSVRAAVSKNYDVKVTSVNSSVRLGKEKRFGQSKKTHMTPTKQFFYVKLDKDNEIKDFKLEDNS